MIIVYIDISAITNGQETKAIEQNCKCKGCNANRPIKRVSIKKETPNTSSNSCNLLQLASRHQLCVCSSHVDWDGKLCHPSHLMSTLICCSICSTVRKQSSLSLNAVLHDLLKNEQTLKIFSNTELC